MNKEINPEFKECFEAVDVLCEKIQKLDVSVNSEEKAHLTHAIIKSVLMAVSLNYSETIGTLEIVKNDIFQDVEHNLNLVED